MEMEMEMTPVEWLERDRSRLESAAKELKFLDARQQNELIVLTFNQEQQQKEKQIKVPPPKCICHLVDLVDYDNIVEQRILRRQREHDAKLVPRRTPGIIYQRYTCTWFGGGPDVSDTEPTCGFNWVAVHGMNSICVAMRKEDLQWETIKRRETAGHFPETALRIFMNGLINKVEVSVVTAPKLPRNLHRDQDRRKLSRHDQDRRKLIRDQASSVLNGERNAISFLQDRFDSRQVFTYDFTVKTAICALGHLFNCEFKANELQVFVWKRKGGRGRAKALTDLEMDEHVGDFVGGREFDEAQEQEIREINEELAAAAMNKSDTCDVKKEMDEELAAFKKRPKCLRHAMQC